jgi:hypothetical protein
MLSSREIEVTYPSEENQVVIRTPTSDAHQPRPREDPQDDSNTPNGEQGPCLDKSGL